jgi:DNA-binding LytR/AlgR family response regulator
MILKTVIVDDEDLAIDLLRHFISTTTDLELKATFTSAKDALEYINLQKPDVLFLDIQMPELNGLNLIQALNYSPIVVLVTAYAEFAQEAYELDVVDYLLKPYNKTRFEKAINKIKQFADFKLNADNLVEDGYMYIKHNGLLKKINYTDIIYIEGLKQYIKIVTKEKKFVTLNSMKGIEEQLSKYNFKRVHKSFIVNFNFEISISSNIANIESFKIPIGRSFRANLS